MRSINIDLGSIYVKISVLKDDKFVEATEVIRLSQQGKNTIDTILHEIVSTYNSNFEDIRRVNLIINPSKIDVELIRYQPILSEKYDKMMTKAIARKRKEEKRANQHDQSGFEDELPEEENYSAIDSLFENFEPIDWGYHLTGKEVFSKLESSDITSSKVYIEYVDSEYLSMLSSITSALPFKDVRLISPIRTLKYLPFKKGGRIIVNYGHNSLIIVVIDNNESIVEVIKQTLDSGSISDFEKIKQRNSAIPTADNSPILFSKIEDLKILKVKYGYPIYTIGGNASNLQEIMYISNIIEKNAPRYINDKSLPLVVENLVLSTFFSDYNDLRYNNLRMEVRNKLVNIATTVTKITRSVASFFGDIMIMLLLLYFMYSYNTSANYVYYNNLKNSLTVEKSNYMGTAEIPGRIVELENQLAVLTSDNRSLNYYSVAELLRSISSPMQIESLDIDGRDITLVAFFSDMTSARGFLELVESRQINKSVKFDLIDSDVSTVYRNGEKADRVVFKGSIY